MSEVLSWLSHTYGYDNDANSTFNESSKVMSDPLKQFLDVQLAVARLFAQQTETLIKEGSSAIEHAVSTANDMHNSGISFLREVMENKAPDSATDSSNASPSPDNKTEKLTDSNSESFNKDRRGFSE